MGLIVSKFELKIAFFPYFPVSVSLKLAVGSDPVGARSFATFDCLGIMYVTCYYCNLAPQLFINVAFV